MGKKKRYLLLPLASQGCLAPTAALQSMRSCWDFYICELNALGGCFFFLFLVNRKHISKNIIWIIAVKEFGFLDGLGKPVSLPTSSIFLFLLMCVEERPADEATRVIMCFYIGIFFQTPWIYTYVKALTLHLWVLTLWHSHHVSTQHSSSPKIGPGLCSMSTGCLEIACIHKTGVSLSFLRAEDGEIHLCDF